MVADRVAKWDNFINQVCLSVTELAAQNWVLLMLLQDLQKLTEKTPASRCD